jgi:hypothetical protein
MTWLATDGDLTTDQGRPLPHTGQAQTLGAVWGWLDRVGVETPAIVLNEERHLPLTTAQIDIDPGSAGMTDDITNGFLGEPK